MIQPLRASGKKPARPTRRHDRSSAARARCEPLLAAQIQAEASVAGSLAAQQANLQTAGSCLKDPLSFSAAPNGLNGLAADLSNLFDCFYLLAGDPSNLPLRHSVVRAAQAVAVQLNHAASRLNAAQIDLNASVQKDVDRVNQLLNEIAGLNRQITTAPADVRVSAGLDGLREQRLQELSGVVNITATVRPDGCVRVSIGGFPMVSSRKASNGLATYRDGKGNLAISTQNGAKRFKPTGGSIAGKIMARDEGLADLQAGLNNLAGQLIARVNSIYNTARSNDRPRHDFFTGSSAADIGVNSLVANDPAQFQVGADGRNTTALDLAQLGNSHVPALGNRTFTQWYAQTVTALGEMLMNVNDNLVSSQAMAQMLANERVAAGELSMHDAANDLMWYQQARAGSGEIITMLDKMPAMT
jgi:flagellar hook-associated protein FlgK